MRALLFSKKENPVLICRFVCSNRLLFFTEE